MIRSFVATSGFRRSGPLAGAMVLLRRTINSALVGPGWEGPSSQLPCVRSGSTLCCHGGVAAGLIVVPALYYGGLAGS